jgi:hypothetical protein
MSLPKQIADDLAKLQADLAALFPDRSISSTVRYTRLNRERFANLF